MRKVILVSSIFLWTILSAYSQHSEFKSQSDKSHIMTQQYNYVWNSIGENWKRNRKILYTNDVNNNRVEALEQWAENSESISKKVYVYDANNYLTDEYVYDYINTSWIIKKKVLYSYDSNKNLIQKTGQVLDGSQYVDESRTVYVYDENNIRLYYTKQRRENSAWINFLKADYYYDENNNYYKIEFDSWHDYRWVYGSRALYTYNDDNNLFAILAYNWDSDLSNWGDPVQRTTYAYDEFNNRIVFKLESWNEYISEWYNVMMSTYYYQPIGSELVEHSKTNLDKPIEDFQTTEDEIGVTPKSKSGTRRSLIGVEVLLDSIMHSSDGDLEFTLSHDGVSETIIYKAGGEGDNFIGTKLTDGGVDSISSGISPFIGNYKPENPLSSFVGTDPSGTWTLSIYDGEAGNTGTLKAWGLNLIYASVSSIPDEPYGGLSYEVFPNPTHDKFRVEGLGFRDQDVTIALFDLSGRKILEKYIPAGTDRMEIDVHSLENGVYFCRLFSNKRSETRKVLIQN